MTQRSRKEAFVLPPHANALTHRRLMERWEKMSDEEFFSTLVRAGIYDQEGRLLPPYADEEQASKPPIKKTARPSQKESSAQRTSRKKTPAAPPKS